MFFFTYYHLCLLLKYVFPVARTFVLFGCIYDVTMIDKAFGNAIICFELSMGSSGYLNSNQLSNNQAFSSVTRPYPRTPIDNNERHFRLPIDFQKPTMFTKYTFHDYSYRMTLSNRLKHAANHMVLIILGSLVLNETNSLFYFFSSN